MLKKINQGERLLTALNKSRMIIGGKTIHQIILDAAKNNEFGIHPTDSLSWGLTEDKL